MAYTSPALEELSKKLECGHCGAIFHGSISQAKHLRYEGKLPYCSKVCRSAEQTKKLHATLVKQGKTPRKGVLCGPCPVCDKKFESRYNKKYCSLECYNKSDDFKEMLKKNYKKGNITASIKWEKEMVRECLVCKESFRSPRSDNNKLGPQKFCSQICYRQFKADLFDAWTANPQNISMPQNYDEFMTQNELPCLVDGCDWHGRHLSVHLNQAHGIKADEFKRAAGFNLSTGLVCPDLHRELCDRDKAGVAIDRSPLNGSEPATGPRGYISKESIESRKKSRMLLSDERGPLRNCDNCGKEFRQSSIFGRTKYCSNKCRNNFYSKKKQCA